MTSTNDDGTLPPEPIPFHNSFPLMIGNRQWLTGGEFASNIFF